MAYRYSGQVHAKDSKCLIGSRFEFVEWANVKLVVKHALSKVSMHKMYNHHCFLVDYHFPQNLSLGQ